MSDSSGSLSGDSDDSRRVSYPDLKFPEMPGLGEPDLSLVKRFHADLTNEGIWVCAELRTLRKERRSLRREIDETCEAEEIDRPKLRRLIKRKTGVLLKIAKRKSLFKKLESLPWEWEERGIDRISRIPDVLRRMIRDVQSPDV